jgi:hypothetical protein
MKAACDSDRAASRKAVGTTKQGVGLCSEHCRVRRHHGVYNAVRITLTKGEQRRRSTYSCNGHADPPKAASSSTRLTQEKLILSAFRTGIWIKFARQSAVVSYWQQACFLPSLNFPNPLRLYNAIMALTRPSRYCCHKNAQNSTIAISPSPFLAFRRWEVAG